MPTACVALQGRNINLNHLFRLLAESATPSQVIVQFPWITSSNRCLSSQLLPQQQPSDVAGEFGVKLE